MKDTVIVAGARTPIGNFGGALKDLPAQRLGELVVREAVARAGLDPALVEEVIVGCVGQTSDAYNVARVIALMAGLPIPTPAYSVQRNCASGLQPFVNAHQNIQSEDADVQVVGGVESMSRAPFISRDMRWGKRLRHAEFIDSIWEGLTDAFCGQLMGRTAETLAEEFGIGREEQDRFAVESHRRAFRAIREGKFKEELLSVTVPKTVAGREAAPTLFAQDEGPNVALTEQQLALYPPLFKEGGTVTAGNSCPLNDGAAAAIVMSAERARTLGLAPLGRIRGYAMVGVEPTRMGIGPAEALPLALKRAGLKLADLELLEVNEAFAAQYLAVERLLGLKREIVNVNGGAIALGHPVGMTGTRLVLTLLYEMRRRGAMLGAVTLCVGGGQGAAMVFERI
ncbi:Acetyl-CoA acetyltransferase [Nitrospira tepida]|uniref:Acetyl-CoA acetyltransferase n=1 Tax=Nitrospira tepida TaxID=2973512 RepID=A0AA86MVT7_9BACT|nr:thiolase family protein [Nitrospira tepida]CAI4029934.1 Acetyl-CoA acetyltransferase [Nitrospira tepida]